MEVQRGKENINVVDSDTDGSNDGTDCSNSHTEAEEAALQKSKFILKLQISDSVLQCFSESMEIFYVVSILDQLFCLENYLNAMLNQVSIQVKENIFHGYL